MRCWCVHPDGSSAYFEVVFCSRLRALICQVVLWLCCCSFSLWCARLRRRWHMRSVHPWTQLVGSCDQLVWIPCPTRISLRRIPVLSVASPGCRPRWGCGRLALIRAHRMGPHRAREITIQLVRMGLSSSGRPASALPVLGMQGPVRVKHTLSLHGQSERKPVGRTSAWRNGRASNVTQIFADALWAGRASTFRMCLVRRLLAMQVRVRLPLLLPVITKIC